MNSTSYNEILETVQPRSLRAALGQFRQQLGERHRKLLTRGPYHALSMIFPWVVAAVAVVMFVNSATNYILLISAIALIYALSAVGLSWLMGRAGLVSIGNAAIMAIGGYTTAILAGHKGWSVFPIPFLVSGVIGAFFGLLIGLPALRIRGVYLALATLALQFVVSFAGNQYQTHTNNFGGLAVRPLTIAGHKFFDGKSFIFLLFGCLGLTVLLLRNMYRQGPGRMWGAIRESELAATAIGVNVRRWKLNAFIGSSALIAISGSFFAYFVMYVSADTYTLDFAVSFIVMIIIGGVDSIAGAIVGATIVTSLPYLLTNIIHGLPQSGISHWLGVNVYYINSGLYGLLVLLFLIYQPEGVVPGLRRLGSWTLRTIAPLPQAVGEPVKAQVQVTTSRVLETARASGVAPVLVVENLQVTYQTGARAVDGVSLRVDRGSIVVVLGRNGAGKTTTLRAISGFLTAEQVRLKGRITIDGVDVLGLPPVKASQHAVLVPERNKIFPSLTVAEHLRICRTRSGPKVEDEAFFATLLGRMNLSAGLLSGGERQLLALAIAWQLKPKLLMVDEFSLGLAPVMIRRITEVIRQLREKEGMTFLIVEQNAVAALELADYVYVMEGGRVVAEGTPDSIDRTEVLQLSNIVDEP